MSSIIEKLLTALRGGVREMGEAVMDADGVRAIEKEIDTAKGHIEDAKRSLTDVMAHKLEADATTKSLRLDIAKREAEALAALKQNDEALALQAAEKIAKLEADVNEQLAISRRYNEQIQRLKNNIQKAEKLIADNERDLAVVQTTDKVQKATLQIADSAAAHNANLGSARETLERIKRSQQMTDYQIEAGEELQAERNEDPLAKRLDAAGLTGDKHSARDILDRLKAQKS
ncbi:Phage shock protein A (IM30), suppresses sigma54-dependent transcription [Hahella chejuensis KCTC 2396]|uniref:Phage shock protein A (IM30), suppresses sigma54-dependent transcription n=1 Tax=Hahella chejuensis (strain KCTC 2396) TaxID=349521 RepID=Q2SNA1_HAHCH|nr:PspA/IM30 family protein [Hahella chejuensis]ABC27873.1 Phage shock protein A (IM30), suppresses sigma54-dependent transcription [Hahella chejuensis KCTC 2396]